MKIEGLGDVVKAVTTLVGIKPCSACERRRKRLNKFLKRKGVTQMATGSGLCSGMNFCPCCGAAVQPSANYCSNCGVACGSECPPPK